jgi:hypothetical protein
MFALCCGSCAPTNARCFGRCCGICFAICSGIVCGIFDQLLVAFWLLSVCFLVDFGLFALCCGSCAPTNALCCGICCGIFCGIFGGFLCGIFGRSPKAIMGTRKHNSHSYGHSYCPRIRCAHFSTPNPFGRCASTHTTLRWTRCTILFGPQLCTL